MPSKAYRYIVAICAVFSVLSIFVLNIDIVYQFILFFLLTLLVFLSLKNNKQRNFQWQPDGSWLITDNKQQYSANLKLGSVVTVFFASLVFTLENKKTLTVIIFKDNINAEKFRQLRVRLKVEGIKPRQSILVDDDG